MKIRMKKRLTAILLCMAMIVSALGSNGVVLAADKSDNTEIPGTAAEAEMLNETSQPNQIVVIRPLFSNFVPF